MNPAPSDEIRLTPAGPALVAAVVTAAVGFGALNVMALIGAGDADLPGLYTFRSATVGDGLLLPILAYALVRAAGLQLSWRRTELCLIAGVAAAAALVGAALQASWLWNPNPRLNWTLPAPHTFNLPGWYHAVFLVVACAFFAAVGTAALLRVRADARRGMQMVGQYRSLGALAVLAPGPAFVGLLLQDNGAPIPIQALGVLIACLVTGALIWWSAEFTGAAWTAIACGASAAAALGFCGLFVERFHNDPSSVLATVAAAFAGAFTTSALNTPSVGTRLGLAGLAAVCGAGAVNGALTADLSAPPAALWAIACSAALVATVIATTRSVLPDGQPPPRNALLALLAVQPLVVFGVAGAFLARTAESNRVYAGPVSVVAAALLLGLTARVVRERFDLVIDAETCDGPTARLSTLKWAAYLAIVGAFGSALFAFLGYILGTTAADSWVGQARVPQSQSHSWALAAMLGAVLAVLVLARLAPRIAGLRQVSVLVACLAGITWCAIMALQLAAGYHSAAQAALSVFIAVIAGLFVLEGIVGNTGALHNVRVDWQVWAVAGIHAAAVALTTAWMTGPALADAREVRSVGPVMAMLGIAVTASVLMPFLAASTLPGATPPRQYAVTAPVAGVLQDAFLVTLMSVSIGWVPGLVLTHMRGLDVWSGNVLYYLAMLSAAYVYVMRNNVGHVTREKSRLLAEAHRQGHSVSSDQWRAHAALATHIRRQNALAMAALVPLGMLVIFNEISGWDRKGLVQLLAVGPSVSSATASDPGGDHGTENSTAFQE